ncbi:MAG TPA: AMP-binding protein [Vicinamibacterales bacterium]|nr:AMP-binding protein [Vicinamibacterales bacterium]
MRERLAALARSQPGRLAFAVGTHILTYGELARDAARLAAALRRAGAAPGGHVAIVLPSGLDFVRAFYALDWLGAAAVPINPDLPPEQIRRRIGAAGCHLEIDAASFEALDEGSKSLTPLDPGPPSPDSVAYLQLTSGTSGEQRAAVILRRNLEATLRGMRDMIGFGPEDVMAGSIPLHHNFGLVRFVCAPVYCGCPCHLTGAPPANVGRWLALLTEVRATVTAAPDFLYRAAALRVDPSTVDLRALRFASNGGEAVHLETIRMFEERFGVPGTVRPGYGLAETTLTVSSLAPGLPLRSIDHGIPSCGPAIPGTEIAIADEDGRHLPRGERGEIVVRGPSVFAGYYQDPEGTARVFRDGWLRTGDQGVLDADGFLYVTGRQRWMIKRGGATIVPGEVEAAAACVPGVLRAAAVGVAAPHGTTERFVVAIEIDPQLGSDGSLLSGLAGKVAAAVRQGVGHQPGEIVLLAPGSLPLTGSGKVRHGQLRDLFASGEADDRLRPLARFS